MLQMSCPNCKGVVNSHFLAEVTTIACGQCKANIPVQDVYIATPYFTIHRDDFVNRTFRFQKLLRDVEIERLLQAKDHTASAKSIECLEQFHSSLHELLDGARDSYRLEIPSDVYVEVNALSRIIRGKLLNLSVDGCSIGFEKIETVPREKSELNIEFFFNGLAEILNTQAKVLWTKKQPEADGSLSTSIGVTFTGIDENTRSCIWNYIINNSPVPFQRL
jgi:hypothetical protein